jgi:hypothetical protein
MTYQGRRVVKFQRSVNPSTRRGINKKRTAVLNWITHPQFSTTNPRLILQLTKDVIMSHQGVRTKNGGWEEGKKKTLSQLYQRDERGGREGRGWKT